MSPNNQNSPGLGRNCEECAACSCFSVFEYPFPRFSSWWFTTYLKYARQIGSFPHDNGKNQKIFELPPSSFCQNIVTLN